MAAGHETAAMIAGMQPVRRARVRVCVVVPAARTDGLLQQALVMVAEDEGLSLILPLAVAQAAGFDCSLPMACLTLQAPSARDGVGLTAGARAALALAPDGDTKGATPTAPPRRAR